MDICCIQHLRDSGMEEILQGISTDDLIACGSRYLAEAAGVSKTGEASSSAVVAPRSPSQSPSPSGSKEILP